MYHIADLSNPISQFKYRSSNISSSKLRHSIYSNNRKLEIEFPEHTDIRLFLSTLAAYLSKKRYPLLQTRCDLLLSTYVIKTLMKVRSNDPIHNFQTPF